jgi:hypothetical protein
MPEHRKVATRKPPESGPVSLSFLFGMLLKSATNYKSHDPRRRAVPPLRMFIFYRMIISDTLANATEFRYIHAN